MIYRECNDVKQVVYGANTAVPTLLFDTFLFTRPGEYTGARRIWLGSYLPSIMLHSVSRRNATCRLKTNRYLIVRGLLSLGYVVLTMSFALISLKSAAGVMNTKVNSIFHLALFGIVTALLTLVFAPIP